MIIKRFIYRAIHYTIMQFKKESRTIEVITHVCPRCSKKLEAYSESQMRYNIDIHNIWHKKQDKEVNTQKPHES